MSKAETVSAPVRVTKKKSKVFSDEDVRELAYLIWEKDRSRSDVDCWIEAEKTLKKE